MGDKQQDCRIVAQHHAVMGCCTFLQINFVCYMQHLKYITIATAEKDFMEDKQQDCRIVAQHHAVRAADISANKLVCYMQHLKYITIATAEKDFMEINNKTANCSATSRCHGLLNISANKLVCSCSFKYIKDKQQDCRIVAQHHAVTGCCKSL
ncbi:hypothetical protein J6590_090068 [Homalodisca vitripennis]|nr:hypothetical protein J6590_090068 [Homalodisca vitripennis]